MITPQDIPLAALEDMLEAGAVIIFIIISILGRLLGGKKNNPQHGRRPRQPQMPQPGKQPPPGAGQQAGGAPVGMEEVLRKEVDEFLRRAQGKPPQPKPRANRPALSETIPRDADSGRQQSAPRRLSPAQKRLAQQGQAEQLPAKPMQRPAVKVRGMGVSEHVAEHISGSTREISQHAEHLGDDLELTDERVEDRLHKKFDHKVGRLQQIETDKVEASVDLSAEIAEMLSNPAGMRQLIIANEILRRPFG
jgi:hypothetical protein